MKRVLIIGSGLAGISIAERLIDRGLDVRVISNSRWPSSTRVATGMFNPIVFRRLNKTWMIDECTTELRSFYSKLESKLEMELMLETSIFKHIPSADYAQFWNNRTMEPEFQDYLRPIDSGLGEVLQAGTIDCAKLVSHYTEYLLRTNRFMDETFQFDAFSLVGQTVEYQNQPFDHAIFCEGPWAVDNPYFNWLPFKIAKGDWVIIETSTALPNRIVNNVINIIPLGSNRYKLSSTFEWETDSWEPNKNQIEPLTQAFKAVYDVDFKVVDHQSGLRPSASDRRPYLGKHPRLPQLSIFNGFGSKGVILAPYFSEHLAQHLIDGAALLPEVDINRHLKRFQSDQRADQNQS